MHGCMEALLPIDEEDDGNPLQSRGSTKSKAFDCRSLLYSVRGITSPLHCTSGNHPAATANDEDDNVESGSARLYWSGYEGGVREIVSYGIGNFDRSPSTQVN